MIRYDSRLVKPKLWNLLALSLAALAVALGMFWVKAPLLWGEWLLALYLAAALALLADAFRKQLEYNPYSYNTIYYAGFFLYGLSVLVTALSLIRKTITQPEIYARWKMVAVILLHSAKNFLLFAFPLVFLFSAALLLSNGELLQREGKSFVNLLGIVLALLLLVGEAVLYNLDKTQESTSLWLHLFTALFLYYFCMLAGTVAADLIAAFSEPDKDRDFLIILGCGMRRDGTPTPLLQGRIDRALRFRRDQLAKTGRDLIFICSGGQGPDEPISEARCMADYLISQGIDPAQIKLEEKSTNTLENMTFSKKIIQELDPSGRGKTAFSTTNYHVFRSGLLSRRVKLRSIGMGAPTKWYFWPNAAVREFVGLLTAHRVKQAVILLTMAALYAGLSRLAA